ncbi:hypothetical protein FGG08_004145 [Glutinoglossum americanum]|uniref:Tail specific protease domain-containing protein n=1 Tax=Glutinoglossum americanum TaxID=1670608 RepID=A0A9P8I9S0_9PEZI|nr:hypothetical protein FGG08_004145 [Glutinoglossum americanum]
MFFSKVAIALLLAAWRVQALPATPTSTTLPNPDNLSGCAKVSALQANPNRPTDVPLKVPAEVALDCLHSVPINKSLAVEHLKGLKNYYAFQSTLTPLKAPPKNYSYPGVDIMDGLDKILRNLQTDVYKNEYDFQFALVLLTASAHDGHFQIAPYIVGSVFGFFTSPPLRMVSISGDGTAIPKIYFYSDYLAMQNTTKPDYNPSSIKQINNQDASAFLQNVANTLGPQQDQDANYNQMFFGTFARSGKRVETLTPTALFLGDIVTVAFENGTTISLKSMAVVKEDFSDVESGQDFYDKFCLPPLTPTPAAEPTSPTSTQIPGYPLPIVNSQDLAVSGYILEGSSLGVLVINTFSPSDNEGADYIPTVHKFLKAAKDSGVRKVIIDVSGNNGGLIKLGYLTFQQFFPDSKPYDGTRFRAHSAADVFGNLGSEIQKTLNTDAQNGTNTTATDPNFSNPADSFAFQSYLDQNGKNFTSFPELFGPVTVAGDNFTNIVRLNLGELEGPKPFPQIFAPEDVILLTDGACASTCTILASFMKQVGVKSIVMGGRPNLGPMQAIGGVKGTQVLEFPTLANITDFLLTNFPDEAAAEGWDAFLPGSLPLRLADEGNSINFRDSIPLGQDTPTQFVYEAADCRVFYTAWMLGDVSQMWRAAAEAMWGKRPCVGGSTGHPSTDL